MKKTTESIPNHLLRRERERRAWSQQDLADQTGTTPLNVSRWERGITMPSSYFRQKLCDVFEKTPQELGLVTQAVTGDSAPATTGSSGFGLSLPGLVEPERVWNVPYRRNPFFTGRDNLLALLRDTLLVEQQPVALAQPQAISGLGGIGKTQTAVEYANRYRDAYHSVFWARAESRDLLISDYLTIAALLNLPQRNDQDQEAIVRAVVHWLDTHEGWLLILDNADDLEAVEDFLPSAGKGHVLLTTRAHSLGTLAERLEIEKMREEEGTLFLLRRIKRLKGSATLETLPEDIQTQARAMVEALDSLPLALDQAGAYIEETGCSLSDYLKYFKTKQRRLLRTRGRDASGHPEPVATTWSLAFEKVEQANPAAAELLRLCAFLQPDAIPESMIIAGASELGSVLQSIAEDEMEWNEAIGELHKFSLIKRDAEEKLLNIHRLVQAVIREGMQEEEQREWADRVIGMVNQAFPEEEYSIQSQYKFYIPQAQMCEEMIERWHLSSLASTQLLHQLGHNLAHAAQYARAESLMRQALDLREQQHGPEHPDVAATLNHLGALYTTQGKLDEAEPLLRRALSIREQAFGPNHPDVIRNLGSLAMLERERGHYAQAEALLETALSIAEQTLGPMHLDTADTLNKLAMTYWYQSKFEQAEPLSIRALYIREQLLGPDDTLVSHSLNDIAVLYDNQGKYEQAEQYYLRSLAIKERDSADHPDLATTISNLALFYSKLGNFDESERLHQRAIAMRERFFGNEHIEIARSLNHLGILYYTRGKYNETEQLWLQALAMRERCVGPEHPDVAESFHNLATLYRILGKYAESESFFLRAIALREQILGMDHVYLAQSLTNFARLYQEQGKFEQAEALLLRALPIREQAMGPDNVEVTFTLQNLGDLYRVQGKFEKAETVLQRALTIREQALPPGHSDIARTLRGLAQTFQGQKDYVQAEVFFYRALQMFEQALGNDHPSVGETAHSLAQLYLSQSKYEQAEPLFQRALSIREQVLGSEHPDTAATLENYSSLLRQTHRESEAATMEARAQAIRAKQKE